jgi:hypothetical protein
MELRQMKERLDQYMAAVDEIGRPPFDQKDGLDIRGI